MTEEKATDTDFFQPGLTPMFHDNDVRVGFAATVFLALVVTFGTKLYFASHLGFKDSCPIDAFFDSMIGYESGALTMILGFYFADRRGSI
jgi:hypothetical protein